MKFTGTVFRFVLFSVAIGFVWAAFDPFRVGRDAVYPAVFSAGATGGIWLFIDRKSPEPRNYAVYGWPFDFVIFWLVGWLALILGAGPALVGWYAGIWTCTAWLPFEAQMTCHDYF